MTRQRILVTGGAGFIGSHTVRLLLEHGKQVTVLDNLTSGSKQNLDLEHPNLTLVVGDVLDFPLLLELVEQVDAVLHLAALASVPASIKDPVYAMQVNTQGFLHVLQAVHHLHQDIRVVYASSAAVYGNSRDLPCHEEFTETPLSPYALQKIHCEQYAELFALMHGVKSMGLRYFNVYGEGQDPSSPYSGVISRFLDAYQQDKEMTIYGDGTQSRDFIHVSDVARANLLALESDCTQTTNIATGRPQNLIELIRYIEDAGQKDAKCAFASARPGDIHSSYGCTDLADSGIAFRASIPLRDGVEKMVNSMLLTQTV